MKSNNIQGGGKKPGQQKLMIIRPELRLSRVHVDGKADSVGSVYGHYSISTTNY